jgi:hypothetical protein
MAILDFLQACYPDESTPCALVATRLMGESDNVASMATIAELQAKGFEVQYLSHASAILSVDFPDALTELCSVLTDATIPIEEIIAGDGGESKGTQRLLVFMIALPTRSRSSADSTLISILTSIGSLARTPTG